MASSTARMALWVTRYFNCAALAAGVWPSAAASSASGQDAGRSEGIERLIAVYDAMKPAEAATIIAALPPDFAAEILTRVQPDAGARIIAQIDPGQAAVLTAHMGARRLTGD